MLLTDEREVIAELVHCVHERGQLVDDLRRIRQGPRPFKRVEAPKAALGNPGPAGLQMKGS